MKTPMNPHSGQCWMSEAEPELGVGFVRDHDAQSVTIEFPSAAQTRRYGKKTAPLRRLEFRVGETITSRAGKRLTIELIETREGLLWYLGGGEELCESELSPTLKLQRPFERFLAGHWDALQAFRLRRRTMDLLKRQQGSPARGMIGSRALLLPHQLYVVDQVSSRGLPRALLADEVGLGKTIEAGWILHRLWVTGRVRRVLIVVPGALVNQWFVELFRRFNLTFWVPDSQSLEGILKEDFATQERVILSLESLKGLEEQGAFDNADWDMVIVDEAHRIEWSEKSPSLEYVVLERVATQAKSLLLLTATPEQLGLEGHFARLRLIDPARFHSFETYRVEHAQYQEVVHLGERLLSSKALSAKETSLLQEKLKGKVAQDLLEKPQDPKNRKKILSALIDYYGTGRVYFRNSRQVVELEDYSFPKRTLKKHLLKIAQNSEMTPVPKSESKLEPKFEPKSEKDTFVQWLGGFGRTHREEKTLLICSSATQVVEWEKRLREEFALKVVAFHERLPLLARDRNAAYFEDPKGASILLASEIGGEGRNFQHACHLILADLPADPDVLEQRIGRLDRIGQMSDITLHVPFFADSREERLLQWHDEVFRAFEAPTKGARVVYEKYAEALLKTIDEKPNKKSAAAWAELIKTAKEVYEQGLREIEGGRDRLVELNSFDSERGSELASTLTDAERVEELREYLDQVLDTLGIHNEDLDADSVFIEPGDSMYVSCFPALPPEGLRVTYSRSKALARNDMSLMSWDHPMITDTMEAIASQEMGNVSVLSWDNPMIVMEASFVLEPAPTETGWYIDEFLPAQMIRVVLDATGKDLSAQWGWEKLARTLLPVSQEGEKLVKQIPPDRLRGLLRKAREQADKVLEDLKKSAQTKMGAAVESEVARLRQLREKNELVSEAELKWWLDRKAALQTGLSEARVRLDAFLLVIPSRLF